jgi:hypothetical protein
MPLVADNAVITTQHIYVAGGTAIRSKSYREIPCAGDLSEYTETTLYDWWAKYTVRYAGLCESLSPLRLKNGRN